MELHLRSALRSGEHDFLIMHLSEHPQEVTAVLGMLHRNREEGQKLLNKLVDSNLVNAADAEPLLHLVTEGLRPPRGGASVRMEHTETDSMEIKVN